MKKTYKGLLIEATQEIEVRVDNLQEFKDKYPNASIQTINGKDFVGFCENCDLLILEDNKHITDVEGCHLCETCMEDVEDNLT